MLKFSFFASAAMALGGCATMPHASAQHGGQPLRAAVAETGLTCAPRTTIVALLAANFAQRPAAQGLARTSGVVPRDSVLEILSSPDGEAWTAILTAPNGTSCVIAIGESWQAIADSHLLISR